MSQCKKIVQCEKCPWRKSTNPLEIPGGYDERKHRNLVSTISEGFRGYKAMACHESAPEDPFPCAGWLDNQLGPGNNLGLRFDAVCGRVTAYAVTGAQHERLEDTFPTAAHKRAFARKQARAKEQT
jgi:hypothetical protein